MSKELLLDEEARKKIAENIDENFFVEAGAGSGKTTSLVTRMVNMVKSGIPVEKISAITYTKAAANEFYERFEKALAKEDDERCAQALKDIDLAFMGTIDSFCNMIISEHPSFVGVPSSVTNRSKDEMDLIYKKEFSRIRAGEYGKELQGLCRRFIDFSFSPETTFVSIISVLMDKRTNDFIYEPVSDEEIREVIDKELPKTFDVLKKIVKEPEMILEGSIKSAEAKDALIKKAAIMNGPVRNIPAVVSYLKKTEDLRLSPDVVLSSYGTYATKLFVEGTTRNKFTHYIFNEEEYILKRLQSIRFSVTMEFMSKCIPPLADKLKKNGDLVFFDYILYLRDTLKEDARNGGGLIRHIYERHSYFLIDEFQDTNPLQIEIFFYLCARELHEDFRKCVPYKGSLFIVGDPKQSIYRFSGADISSFMSIRELFTHEEIGEVLCLSQNFRSTGTLCSWFNKAFEEILVNDDNDQAGYSAIPLERKKKDEAFTGVYKYRSLPADKDDPSLPECDPCRVKEIILRMMNDKSLKIEVKENNEKIIRNLKYRDFMLISPAKTHLSSYMKVLRENGIPFRVEGKTLFDDCKAFILLVKIYGALAYPKDNIRVYNALISEYFGMSDSEIYTVFGKNDVKLDLNLDAECEQLNELKDTLRQAKTLTPSGLYEYIMDRFEIFRHTDTLNMEYVYYGLELLKDKEMNNEISGIREACDYLESLLHSEADIERCMSLSRAEDKVHLANAHKVKGLEAPVVILIDGKASDRAPVIRVEREDKRCYVFEIKNRLFQVLSCNDHEEKKEEEKKADAAEKDRLLYVSATRAGNVLIVNETLTKSGNPAKSRWAKAVSYIEDDIFKYLPEETVCLNEKKEIEYPEDIEVLDKSSSLKSSYRIARPSKEVETKLSEDYVPSLKKDAALIGTLAHRLMEVLVLSGNKIDLDEAVREIIGEYCDDDEYYELLHMLGTAIRNGGFKQEGEACEDILNELLNADEAYCEVPFSYMEDDELWNGIIDVLYRKGDQWYILDYKTNADPSDLDEKYKAQLDAYRKAVKESSGIDAKTLIYHLGV
ncbi:MAG: UvrD-helicase domain-containing protein [Erysipelotrichaceae bacterium]|nr:UvrD-helicase domain-containing protein [Erysipelotrichaceae bacterium]